MSSATAFESCCIFDDMLLVSLWLGFSCPNIWETIGQPICDLANELIQNSQWDYNEFFDPLSSQLLVQKCLPPDTLFGYALPLADNLPINDKGKGNIYIDDSIFVCPDLPDNIEKKQRQYLWLLIL